MSTKTCCKNNNNIGRKVGWLQALCKKKKKRRNREERETKKGEKREGRKWRESYKNTRIQAKPHFFSFFGKLVPKIK